MTSKKIAVDPDPGRIRRLVNGYDVALLRNFVTPAEVAAILNLCRRTEAEREPSNPPPSRTAPNFHRINDNPPKSTVKGRRISHHMHFWNPETAAIEAPFRRMHLLRNEISGLDPEFGFTEGDYIAVPHVMHYPRGGGWLARHSDPDTGQKVVIDVILSRRGVDFGLGGLYGILDDEKLDLEEGIGPGDAVCIHPATVHGVDPIDPEHPLDWSRPDGRWMMFTALVTWESLKGVETDFTRKAIAY
jgi:hypothetical protein